MRSYLSFLLLACIASSAYGAEVSKLKLDTGIEIFTHNTTEPSALAVNEDGTRIYWIAKKSKKSLLEPIDIFYSSTDINNVFPVRIKRGFGDLYTAVAPIVDSEDEVVIDHENYTLGAITRTILHRLITGDDTPKGYRSCIDIRNVKSNKSVKELCAKELGLKKELLAHARISPDKNWLTFYLKGEKNPAGIYLFNMNTGVTVLLGEFNDKHPTWTPDGSKIMFHFQRGGNTKSEAETEEAFIGWYDLELNQDSIVSAKRHLIDDPALIKSYTYQKHPTMISGTNFVLYHGQDKIDGAKKLYLRELKADSKIRVLSMKLNDCSVKSTKHAAVGYRDHFVYFVGKTACEVGGEEVKSDFKIMRLDINTFIGKLK